MKENADRDEAGRQNEKAWAVLPVQAFVRGWLGGKSQRAILGVGSGTFSAAGGSTVLPLFACAAFSSVTGSCRRTGMDRFSPSRVNVRHVSRGLKSIQIRSPT